jgi:amino-acid N-acetyltransferase
MSIVPLGSAALDEVRSLLDGNGLHTSDLTAEVRLLGERDGEGLAGVVGLEARGHVGLLRSLAVRANRRGTGLGSDLVAALEALAARDGITELYLLTTTAEAFFARRGYRRLPREAAPAGIRETVEFSSLCPASSAFMAKRLG